MLGADFAEHGIVKCINTDKVAEQCKDIGIQYPSRLSLRDENMKNDEKETSNYCNKGILNFGYLSISERLTSKINKSNNEKSKESTKDIDKVKWGPNRNTKNIEKKKTGIKIKLVKSNGNNWEVFFFFFLM